MSDQLKRIFNISLWLSILFFICRSLWSWKTIIAGVSFYDLYGYAGEAISFACMLTMFYEKVLWRYNPFESTPKLSKKYKGTIKSSYDNIERSAALEIHQTLLSVSVILISNESKSKTLSASIDDVLGEKQLTYCYLNTPKSEFRHRSEIHYGTATLCLSDTKELNGQYYTDRKTIGDMHFVAEK